jgi:hypothetical protein
MGEGVGRNHPIWASAAANEGAAGFLFCAPPRCPLTTRDRAARAALSPAAPSAATQAKKLVAAKNSRKRRTAVSPARRSHAASGLWSTVSGPPSWPRSPVPQPIHAVEHVITYSQPVRAGSSQT